jgi:hypothetical protein
MSFSKPGRRDDLLFAFALRVNLGFFICLRLIVRQPRNNISRRSAIPKHCEGLAASADPSFAPSLRGGAIGRGGAPLGKGDGGFRKKVSPLYKGQDGVWGYPPFHKMEKVFIVGGLSKKIFPFFFKKKKKNHYLCTHATPLHHFLHPPAVSHDSHRP